MSIEWDNLILGGNELSWVKVRHNDTCLSVKLHLNDKQTNRETCLFVFLSICSLCSFVAARVKDCQSKDTQPTKKPNCITNIPTTGQVDYCQKMPDLTYLAFQNASCNLGLARKNAALWLVNEKHLQADTPSWRRQIRGWFCHQRILLRHVCCVRLTFCTFVS